MAPCSRMPLLLLLLSCAARASSQECESKEYESLEASLPSSSSPSSSSSSSPSPLSSSLISPSPSPGPPSLSSALARPPESPATLLDELRRRSKEMSREELLAAARSLVTEGGPELEKALVHYNHYCELYPSDREVRREAADHLGTFYRLAAAAIPPRALGSDDITRPPLLLALAALKEHPSVQRQHHSFKLFTLPAFLTAEECEGLIAIHDHIVRQSGGRRPMVCSSSGGFLEADEATDYYKGTTCLKKPSGHAFVSALKLSNVTAIYQRDYELSDAVLARVRKLLGLSDEAVSIALEAMPEGWHQPAATACDRDDDTSPVKRSAVTLAVFLNSVPSGGGLSYPHLQREIPRVPGTLVAAFNYDSRGRCDALGAVATTKVGGSGGADRAFNLQISIDNSNDIQKMHRVLSTVPMVVQGRRPYQPVVLCGGKESSVCRNHFESPSVIRQASRFT